MVTSERRPTTHLFNGMEINWRGEGIYGYNRTSKRWVLLENYSDVAYYMRVGSQVEWVDPEDIYEIDDYMNTLSDDAEIK